MKASNDQRRQTLRESQAANFATKHGTNRKADARYDKRQVDFQKTMAGSKDLSGYHKPGSRKKVY